MFQNEELGNAMEVEKMRTKLEKYFPDTEILKMKLNQLYVAESFLRRYQALGCSTISKHFSEPQSFTTMCTRALHWSLS
jgi:hypothetical protein